MARARLVSLDAVKGMAIVLVVLGHIVARDMPAGDTWFVLVKETIYKFHMPLFMFVTGLVYGYGRKPLNSLKEYGRFAVQKTKRLVPAWLLFALIIFFGKYVGGRFIFVDNQVTDPADFFRVITAPKLSFAMFLWYIYIIYIYYLIEPLIYKLTRGRLLYALPVALLLYFLPSSVAFGLDLAMEYAFVFLLGVYCGDNYPAFHTFIRRFGFVVLALFVATLPWAVAWQIPKLVMGLLAIGGFTWLAEFSFIKNNHQIQQFATFTFAIYLMNTIAIGLAKAVLLRFFAWNSADFLFMAPLMLLSGLYLPILVRQHLISRSRALSTIIA